MFSILELLQLVNNKVGILALEDGRVLSFTFFPEIDIYTSLSQTHPKHSNYVGGFSSPRSRMIKSIGLHLVDPTMDAFLELKYVLSYLKGCFVSIDGSFCHSKSSRVSSSRSK